MQRIRVEAMLARSASVGARVRRRGPVGRRASLVILRARGDVRGPPRAAAQRDEVPAVIRRGLPSAIDALDGAVAFNVKATAFTSREDIAFAPGAGRVLRLRRT